MAGRPTTYSSYMRGVPQSVAYVDGTSEGAVVNGLGQVTSITNAAGTTTAYGYDAMGRISSITYPTESGFSYHPTSQAFEQVLTAEYGIAAGHWRQTISTGNTRTVKYFDALWRERVVRTWDNADAAATARITETRYDDDGRKVFQGYPLRTLSAVDTAIGGTAFAFDGLGRETVRAQDSELGVLQTITDYLPNFQKRVTNPRGYQTTHAYYAYDKPSEDWLYIAWMPEGAALTIYRDAFNKATSITRNGNYGGNWLSATRSYVYDGYQRLCKTIEPEAGATVQAYDAAGNVAWRASGQSLPSTASCDHASVGAASKISYGYDARNRVTSASFGDGSPGVGRSYTPDGLDSQVWTGSSTWVYEYNNRRLLTSEQLAHSSGTYSFARTIDAHGNVAALTYPDGATVGYSPNALGEATVVGAYASAISYHPNAAVAGYTLANGVAHSTTQTVRGLPLVWRDAGVIQDQYTYDANGNPTAITDQQEGGLTSRSLAYDGLDRLVSASGIWGAGSYSYDPLDNIRTSTVGGRTAIATLDAANRLSVLTLNGVPSSFGYDANGNLSQRGAQTFTFDIGNRLVSAAGRASYTYDGHGRRTQVNYADGSWKVQVYGHGGQILYSKYSNGSTSRHIYLGTRLIAEVNSASGTTYVHTDPLGSAVAHTNSVGVILTRSRYEPYGGTAAGTTLSGPAFAGHVNDADTGLVYMQQRYYEPLAGRFLSVDPVATDGKDGSSFNRYAYANNSPYVHIDPDGREIVIVGSQDFQKEVTNALAKIAVGDGGKALVDAANSTKVTILIFETNADRNVTVYTPDAAKSPQGSSISWNPSLTKSGPDDRGNTQRPAFVGLAHELGHAVAASEGKQPAPPPKGEKKTPGTTPPSEQRAMQAENTVRREHGLAPRSFYYPKESK
jgi:RHS repeat-associated protein